MNYQSVFTLSPHLVCGEQLPYLGGTLLDPSANAQLHTISTGRQKAIIVRKNANRLVSFYPSSLPIRDTVTSSTLGHSSYLHAPKSARSGTFLG